MNIFLFLVCMTVLPAITGRGMLAVLYRGQSGKFHMADWLIMGWLVTIGLAEGAHLAAVFFGYTFSGAVRLLAAAFVVIVVLCGLAGFFMGKSGKKGAAWKRKKRRSPGTQNELTPLRFGMILALTLPAVWQIVTIVSQESTYRTGDMMVETVESFLQTDAVYAVNPLTGSAYTQGLPLRIKILGLPTLYGGLCKVFGMAGVDLVWRYIPLLMLLLCYCAYWLIANVLFDREEEREKQFVFMVLVALIICVGDYACGMDGFGLLHCGYQGVVIRNVVLVPYTLASTLRRKWFPALFAALAEACITWTFYGLGVSLFVLVGMAVIWRLRSKRAGRFQVENSQTGRGEG